MILYRYTNSKDPMSDWGHAMFSEDQYSVENYGVNGFIIEDSICTDIFSLHDEIVSKWKEFQQEWAEYDDFYDMDAEDLFNSLAPTNIVDSADGYDHDLTLQWFWDHILQPKDIWAIRTPDGAIVFDADLIKPLQ